MPRKKKINLPPDWGVELTPDIAWIEGFSCKRCGSRLDKPYDNVIGYTRVAKVSEASPNGGYLGSVITQCPRCEKRYWFHAHYITLVVLRTMARKGELKDYPLDSEGKPL